METRANFILIGIFTLAGVFGLLGFLVWLARVEIDRQYTQYDILFPSVSGLGRAADVRFNGLSVGQVLDLGLYEQDPNRIRVRIEVDASTPIKADTVAQMQSQGVTGVSYVALTGGSPAAALMQPGPDGAVPIIPSERSVVQALTEDAPDLVQEAIDLLRNLQAFVGTENQDYVGGILKNVERASGSLDAALEDFSSISKSFEEGASKITGFTDKLDEISQSIQTTLEAADRTLGATERAVDRTEETLVAATNALNSADSTFNQASNFIAEDLTAIAQDARDTLTSVEKTVTGVGEQVTDIGGRLGAATDLANQRLTEIEKTIAYLDETLEIAQSSMTAVESASVSFQSLVDGEGAILVAESRETLAKANSAFNELNRVLTEDVSVIASEIRSATETANSVIEAVGADLTNFTGRIDPVVTQGEAVLAATVDTVKTATETLARVDIALASAEKTFAEAQTTFARATELIDTDVGPALGDIRNAASGLQDTVAAVAADIPAVTEDLRTTIAKIADVVDRIDETVAASAPPFRAFAETGLPQFTSFARTAQALVTRLDRLARQIERDPPRFFLGGNISEYRRR